MKNIPFRAEVNRHLPRDVQQQRLHRVLREELTELQRYTVIAYYFRDRTLQQIARERGVNKSTVCRTLHRAEAKLKRCLQ